MNMREIVKDSVNYPLSDWKKILMLGIIVLISGISGTAISLYSTSIYLISILVIIGLIIGFLVNGYMFRIVRLSLDGVVNLPKFNQWIDMCVDGFKVFIVFIVYLIPVILIMLGFVFLSLNSISTLTWEAMGVTPLEMLISSLNSVVLHGITFFTAFSYDLSLVSPDGFFALIIGLLYMIMIIPIFLVAIANMAYYEGDFKSAFRFHEILNEISSIGWFNLIKWYIVAEISFLIMFIIIINVVGYTFSLIHHHYLRRNVDFIDCNSLFLHVFCQVSGIILHAR